MHLFWRAPVFEQFRVLTIEFYYYIIDFVADGDTFVSKHIGYLQKRRAVAESCKEASKSVLKKIKKDVDK